MSGYRRSYSALTIAAIVAALGPDIARHVRVVEEPQLKLKPKRRAPAIAFARTARAASRTLNGGHARKRAIREARLRKFGTRKHGRYR